MKNILRLEVERVVNKDNKMSKEEVGLIKKKFFQKAVKTFREGVQDLVDSKRLSILEEIFPHEVLVEYNEKDRSIKERFLKLEIISIIDQYWPPQPKKIVEEENTFTVKSAKDLLLEELENRIKNIKIKEKK